MEEESINFKSSFGNKFSAIKFEEDSDEEGSKDVDLQEADEALKKLREIRKVLGGESSGIVIYNKDTKRFERKQWYQFWSRRKSARIDTAERVKALFRDAFEKRFEGSVHAESCKLFLKKLDTHLDKRAASRIGNVGFGRTTMQTFLRTAETLAGLPPLESSGRTRSFVSTAGATVDKSNLEYCEDFPEILLPRRAGVWRVRRESLEVVSSEASNLSKADRKDGVSRCCADLKRNWQLSVSINGETMEVPAEENAIDKNLEYLAIESLKRQGHENPAKEAIDNLVYLLCMAANQAIAAPISRTPSYLNCYIPVPSGQPAARVDFSLNDDGTIGFKVRLRVTPDPESERNAVVPSLPQKPVLSSKQAVKEVMAPMILSTDVKFDIGCELSGRLLVNENGIPRLDAEQLTGYWAFNKGD